MVYAAELACLAGLLTEAEVAEHRRILAAFGLPTAYRIWPEVDREARWAALATATVSYTHLDVYKRQVHWVGCKLLQDKLLHKHAVKLTK